MLRAALVAIVAAATFAIPTAAEAKTKRVLWQQSAAVADRFFDQIGFIPTNSIQPQGAPAQTVKAGTVTYKVGWANVLYNRRTTTAMLRELNRRENEGVYTDRRLTSREKRRWEVLIDLARDADVVVVHPDNPVCASGLTMTQAHG